MTTVTPPTSNEKAPHSMEWDSLSEDDQDALIKFLEEPSTLQNFSDACKNIGQTAVSIDLDFKNIKLGFVELVKNYGNDFPDVGKVYLPQWDEFMARWSGDAGLLWSSRKLAADTAATLTDYGLNLTLIAEIKTQDDLEGAQIELKDYVKKHPIDVATTVADGFKNLRSGIEDFSKDFKTYLDDQQQPLTDDANKYEGQITEFQGQISSLNEKIKITAIALGLSLPFTILFAIPAGLLGSYIVQRNNAQANLDKAKADLATTIAKQEALAAMQTEFENLKPGIDEICHNLGIFATLWAYMTEQSTELNKSLDDGMVALTRKKFQKLLEVLIKQIAPLQEGMRQYAIQITPP